MDKKTQIKNFVGSKIYLLQAEAGTGGGNAMLANLRRGIGHEIGEQPQLFGLVLRDLPEEFWSVDGAPTREEWVCFTCLTLYALHQQGCTKEHQMHTKENVSMGTALYRMSRTWDGDPNAEERMLQRLQKVVTAVDKRELSYHLRCIVQLLRSRGIALNYEMLAGDLYELLIPGAEKQVVLRWGQDFYGRKNQQEEKGKES